MERGPSVHPCSEYASRRADILFASSAAPPFGHLLVGCTFVGIGRKQRRAALLPNRELVDRFGLLNLLDRSHCDPTLRSRHRIELRPSAGTISIGNTCQTEQYHPGYCCCSLHLSYPLVRQATIPGASADQV
jgi:hypothetical protein